MYNRTLRTKLPEVDKSLDEEVRDRDNTMKHKNKLCIDEKRGARERELQNGDHVLVKQPKQDKMSTPFYPTPYTLVNKTGNSCIVESPKGVQYTRNSTYV